MRRVGETVQEADRDAVDLLGDEAFGKPFNRGLVERRDDLALGIDALRHDKAQPARHQRRREVDIDVVLLKAVFVPDLDRVTEPLGRDEGGLGALTLDDRVGREGRAVDDQRQIPRGECRLEQDLADRRDDGALRRFRRGQNLNAEPLPADGVRHFERDIGKGAADIDPKPPRPFPTRRHAAPSPA